MANSPGFVDYLRELMRASGRTVSARAMFGGHGLYIDGLFVGIVDDDVVYLRVDELNRAEFEALDLPPFEYETKDGVHHAMRYLRAPDDALENAQAMAPWVRSALGAALRAAAKAPAKRKPAKKR